MAITFDDLKELVTREGLRFFVAPDEKRLMVGVSGMCGKFQIVISLYDEGIFLQFRTVNYMTCPPNHPALAELLKAMADANYQTRLVKFAWDGGDGEVVAYADLWLMDATLTQAQLHRMLGNYVPAIDMQSYRFQRTLKEGKDPGRVDPNALVGELLGRDDLPPEVRAILEGIRKGGKDDKDDKDEVIEL